MGNSSSGNQRAATTTRPRRARNALLNRGISPATRQRLGNLVARGRGLGRTRQQAGVQ